MRGGIVIKRARKLKGVSQAFVAENYGVALNTIKNYESGRTEPLYVTVMEILTMLRVKHEDVSGDI